ncbi:MAG: primosomal protein N' [Candidatus Aminicenantes bacterium]|nr:MAG: primosomal protein N' [Candidatus Aminicenantes bacterium]
MTLYAEITLPLPLGQTFSYLVPDSYRENVKIGTRVLVPFHKRLLTGFIVDLKKRRKTRDLKLKEILEILDENPIFSPSFLSFTKSLSDYYYSSWGELLQSSVPPSFIIKSKKRISISENGKKAIKNEDTPKEERELLGLLQKKSYSDLFLKRKFKNKNISYLLSRLETKRLIHIQSDIKKVKRRKRATSPLAQTQLEIDFSMDTQSLQIANKIIEEIGKQAFSPFFLYGSSKKRESVYFYLIKRILADGKKVLFLVPEIALTQSLREKFERKLGEKVALFHSRLSESRRELEWQRIKEGEADVVVGPRSALFSPLEDLGLIIVDEEQDDSYYQQESPSYDARNGARLRAKQEKAVLVYGSSVPSVEAFYRAKKKGYLLQLEDGKRKNMIEILDERQERRLISRRLEERIRGRLKKKEPVLIFFNRRGFASFLLCSRCNYIPRCIRCDIALTYHKREEKLICHYCDYSIARRDDCPECGSRIVQKRGVGIEAVEEELRKIFPLGRIACFDTDVVKGREVEEKILGSFQKGEIDILIGTQLLAHQSDLPQVSLVVVLHPETILALSDYRASQRTFQTLNQMMKSLLNDKKAEAVIQTALPNHFSIRCGVLQDYLSFYGQEIKFRRLMNYPPFSHIVEIVFQGENLRTVARESRGFSARIRKDAGDVEILGPALAPVARVRARSRVQVILKARKRKKLDVILKGSLGSIKLRKSILVYD